MVDRSASIDPSATFWGIHAGASGDVDELFLRHKRVAIGWWQVGNLGALGNDREGFKARYADVYPDQKPGAVPVSAGQLFRFVHEVAIGDIVVYPRKFDRTIHIGRVTGKYEYAPSSGVEYPNQRPVEWLGNYPRSSFSQGALYEVGSAMSLFRIKNYAEEFRAVLEGRPGKPGSGDDELIAYVAKDVSETTEDFVIKKLARDLKGPMMEGLVGSLMEAMGYHATVTRAVRDDGIDVVAHRDELGLEPPIIKVQVKSEEAAIGPDKVKALYAMVEEREVGLFITLGKFTRAAQGFARTKSNLRLLDGREFVEQFLKHYDRLDRDYRNMIPLQQVYVPAPGGDEE